MEIKSIDKRQQPVFKRNCYLCFEFTLDEFTEEQIKICEEHWMDAENCPNWKPVNVFTGKKRKLVVWVD